MNSINIVIYRIRREVLNDVFKELRRRLDIKCKYDKSSCLISMEEGLICPVYIIGKYGDPTRLAGLRPDFYNAENGEINWFLEQAASKLNGVKLDDVRNVLKIVDILKMPEGERVND